MSAAGRVPVDKLTEISSLLKVVNIKKDVITYPIEGDPMAPSDGIKIVLKRSPEDLPQFSPEYQADMGKVFTALHNEGTKFEATAFAMDGVDAVGGATGEILALAKTLGPATIAAIAAFLAGRNGRKVKIKVGEIEAEANSVKELNAVLERVEKIKHDNKPKHSHE